MAPKVPENCPAFMKKVCDVYFFKKIQFSLLIPSFIIFGTPYTYALFPPSLTHLSQAYDPDLLGLDIARQRSEEYKLAKRCLQASTKHS